ncbi:hypothetical protein ACOME3_009026 [Neoechinorhynchus agilis]
MAMRISTAMKMPSLGIHYWTATAWATEFTAIAVTENITNAIWHGAFGAYVPYPVSLPGTLGNSSWAPPGHLLHAQPYGRDIQCWGPQTARHVFPATTEWISRDPDMLCHERSTQDDEPLPAMQWDEELLILVPGTLPAFSRAELSRVILRRDCLQHPAVGIECDRGSIYAPGAFDILGLRNANGEANDLPAEDYQF